MDQEIILIKNMVCHRCILAVKDIMITLGLPYKKLSLGEVHLEKPISKESLSKLEEALRNVGFALITEKNEAISNRIKSIIIEDIYQGKNFSNKNLSFILSEALHMDYSHLSSVFSHIEGRSIIHFQQEIKSERVKELLEYNELNISEIANELGYSSAAYLSTQFKKSTGMTPSQYKTRLNKSRNSLDKI